MTSPIVLNKETLLPVGAITGGAVVLVAIVVWVTGLRADYITSKELHMQLEARLREVEVKQSAQDKWGAKMDERISNIEQFMKETRDDVKKLLTAQSYRGN